MIKMKYKNMYFPLPPRSKIFLPYSMNSNLYKKLLPAITEKSLKKMIDGIHESNV